MARNNPELISQLISSLDKEYKNAEQSLAIINKHLDQLNDINYRINQSIEQYSPQNARKIAKYIDDNNDQFKKLINDQMIIDLRKKLNNTETTLNALVKYYKDSYIKTVDMQRGGY